MHKPMSALCQKRTFALVARICFCIVLNQAWLVDVGPWSISTLGTFVNKFLAWTAHSGEHVGQMIKGHMQNMSRFVIAIATVTALCVCAPAEASIVVTVDKSAQRLSVAIDGSLRYQWPVSTARWGYSTPNGSYRPERLARKWFSRKYDWSPMPYSIFFDGGYAIHGSYEIAHLGRPASHGCIRLHPQNAAILFALIKEHMGETSIVVTGQAPTPSGGKWQWQY